MPPDDYYHPQFHFCEPPGGPRKQPESLGSILFGDRIFNSPYDVRDPPFRVLLCLMFALDSNVAGQCYMQVTLYILRPCRRRQVYQRPDTGGLRSQLAYGRPPRGGDEDRREVERDVL